MVDAPSLEKFLKGVSRELGSTIRRNLFRYSIGTEEFSAYSDENITGGITIFHVVNTGPATESVNGD